MLAAVVLLLLPSGGGIIVQTPEALKGQYFHHHLSTIGKQPGNSDLKVSGKLVYTTPTSACTAISNPSSVEGNIAIVLRGSCNFETKAFNVKEAGAIALIIRNTSDKSLIAKPETITAEKSLRYPSIGIPVFSISSTDGLIIAGYMDVSIEVTIAASFSEYQAIAEQTFPADAGDDGYESAII